MKLRAKWSWNLNALNIFRTIAISMPIGTPYSPLSGIHAKICKCTCYICSIFCCVFVLWLYHSLSLFCLKFIMHFLDRSNAVRFTLLLLANILLYSWHILTFENCNWNTNIHNTVTSRLVICVLVAVHMLLILRQGDGDVGCCINVIKN